MSSRLQSWNRIATAVTFDDGHHAHCQSEGWAQIRIAWGYSRLLIRSALRKTAARQVYEFTPWMSQAVASLRSDRVVAVYQRDIAETKATRATEAGRSKGYPLMFTTGPEE